MWGKDASTLLEDMSSPRCLRLSHRPTRLVMEVSLVGVPTQPGRGDLAFSIEPRVTEFSISSAWKEQAQWTEHWREVIYKSDGFLPWIPNGLNWNHLCMEKHRGRI